jgi:hypothetical protein
MKLEVVIFLVSDADRAKDFYTKLGWRPLLIGRLALHFQSCNSLLPARTVPSSSA